MSLIFTPAQPQVPADLTQLRQGMTTADLARLISIAGPQDAANLLLHAQRNRLAMPLPVAVPFPLVTRDEWSHAIHQGWGFAASTQNGASAGNNVGLQLYNPTGSGIVVALRTAWIVTLTGKWILGFNNTDPGIGLNPTVLNQVLGGAFGGSIPTSVVHLKIITAATLGALIPGNRIYQSQLNAQLPAKRMSSLSQR